MKILMLSATFPYPPTRGGTAVRTFNLLKYLKGQGHYVSLGTLRTPDVTDAEIDALRDSVDELAVYKRNQQRDGVPAVDKVLRLAQFAMTSTPPSVRASHSDALQQWVNQQIETGEYDVVTCEHCVNEHYLPDSILSKIPTAVVNIHSSVYGTCAQQLATGNAEHPLRDRINLPLLKRYEHRYCQKFSQLVVTTPEDQQQIADLSGKSNIHVIPNGVDLETFTPRISDPGGHSLVFIGAMDNLPNIDAVTFLAKDIFPAVQQRYPDVTLALVGARPTPAVKALDDIPGVTVTGKVPAMLPYLHQATVAVVPMRMGYGIKNKTLEAMAAGVPVVASDRGWEGLDLGEGVYQRGIEAASVADYNDAITQLFEQPALRERLSRNGRAYIESDFTWAIAGDRYEQVLARSS